jgi:acetyl-CoA carboxylase biotin carboxyl carrier protein
MTDKFNISEDAVRQLARILTETGLTEIEYETEFGRIRVGRATSMDHTILSTPAITPSNIHSKAINVPSQAPEKIEPIQHPGTIKSPMVGTVYLSSEPGGNTFVKKGDIVQKGQTLLIVEAMKVMNPIKAIKSGTVVEICVVDSSPVEFNEPLIIIE